MAVTIANSNPSPEYLESVSKSILVPAINFVATLTRGGPVTVEIVGPDDTVYGTFVLDTINQPVSSGLITNLANKLRYRITAGTGAFTILCMPGVG